MVVVVVVVVAVVIVAVVVVDEEETEMLLNIVFDTTVFKPKCGEQQTTQELKKLPSRLSTVTGFQFKCFMILIRSKFVLSQQQ